MARSSFFVTTGRVGLALLVCLVPEPARGQGDAEGFLEEADRLAWLRVWSRAEPLYAKAHEVFVARGDKRNAIYAEVGQLRGKLPTLSVPEASERLSQYLDESIVQSDERLRLRVLVIKAETDEDLDPGLSQRSWAEALSIAEKLGEPGWANRARGELGMVAFLLGDTNTAIVNLGQAIKVAEASGDTSSVVRWLTLFGHGYVELNRPEQALDFYDRALKVARRIPELQLPVMTFLGKSDALMKLGRVAEAEELITSALAVAKREGSLGYQAELTLRLGLIALHRKESAPALKAMAAAADLARAAGGNRILAGIALERSRVLRAENRTTEADAALREGISSSRSMGERLMLPRLLAQLADLRLTQGRRAEALDLLREADDLLEGLLTNASSPWVRGRILASMDDVVSARIRLEGERSAGDPTRLFAVLERSRGRSLVDLLHARPLSQVRQPQELRDGERRIASLQLQLLQTTGAANRQRLLDQIFVAEERLSSLSTELFTRSQRTVRSPLRLRDVQAVLRPDEVLFEIALAEPASFAIVLTRSTARVRRLTGRAAILAQSRALVSVTRDGRDTAREAKVLGATLLGDMPELVTHRRLIVSAEGGLQQVPFELLGPGPSANSRLLETHVVSYTQSGSVLALLRARAGSAAGIRMALAIGASPEPAVTAETRRTGTATQGIYDNDAAQLAPLPLASDEARFVGGVFGDRESHVLVGGEATEAAVKERRLSDYRILHVAAHGLVSTKVPARSALLLRPSGAEDGLLQAREILNLRLNAALVTLSACDTSAGAEQGQDGVASLVRPFVAAGARAVVANLWAADDTFSTALMREFYRQLAAGADIGEALRRAKLRMIESFGSEAIPKLWSGVLAFGDAASVVVPSVGTAQ